MNAPTPSKIVPGATPRLKVAVIGSGISGASAAWALDRCHDVTLYEAENRPGGHTATVDIDYDGKPVSVDTGFIVYNTLNYPNLTAMFEHLEVDTHESDMSFSLSLDQGKLEWCGDNLASVFAQKRNLFRPSFLLMLREIFRFNKLCVTDREAGHLHARSIGDYLDWRGFSPGFRNNYLVPMAAAIWSTPAHKMLDFPATHFVNFFDNHRLIHSERPQWRTVSGGSRNYLSKLLAPLGDRLRLSSPVRNVKRDDRGVEITDGRGRTERFDHVILACHTDQALAILDKPTATEAALLPAIPYRPNRVVLHRDPALMPKRRKAWASWNYLRSTNDAADADVAVSYWMNRLQGIDHDCPLFVTLNPDREPDADKVFAEFSYDHPQFGTDAMEIQEGVEAIQGHNATSYAGAWTRYGFHEDGLLSGIKAAERLGASFPWRDAPAPADPAVFARAIARREETSEVA
ncbi:FAD-dependent oxidoreductase [Pseudohoeflea suaedae]|uniref:FAD-dependent oxidoreductase n=1 Tax=Pseudohoeflea suaedae TaxID=877384 RepID=A0A4R5PKE5_9HYPH|nr:FAD-dependent oxidoreductase [Pseudohoeflea suaedae]TDH36075.1 FAD-dependent oxidoreductase [Pseudohoeflea suaedae]